MNISRCKRFRSSMFRFRLLTTGVRASNLAAPTFGQTGTSPWENAVRVLQQAFSSISLVAIVVAGLTFAFGEGGFPNAKESIAEKHGLPVGNGTIPVPELRIEYEPPEIELRHVDLELAPRDYRPRAMAGKASTGFSVYGRSEDAPRLRRVFDEREITSTNPHAMNIAPVHLDALEALGYTEAEARFLYIVATHSGYFVARQFLAFTAGHWGARTASFWNKLHTKKHARTECFPKSGTVYHLFARRLYRQIDRENIRNRRQHEIEYIQRRIGMLDFVLSHPQWKYLETEPEKISFFCEQLQVPMHFLPSKIYHGQRTSQPTVRYFVDKFPMFLGSDASSPAVTFTYLQGAEASLTGFVHHIEACLPLFRQLSEFRFLYLARVDSHFEKAKELFDSLVAIPLGSDVSADLLRYFQVRKAWDLSRYTSLTEADLIFRNQAKTRFAGQRFEHLYRGWKVGRVTETDIRQEFRGSNRHTTVHFVAEVLCRVAVPEQESEGKR